MPAAEPRMLVANDLRVAFGGLTVVDGAAVEVESGRIGALVGPNGSGKTSLVNAIAGYVPAAGDVTLRGARDSRSLTSLPPERRARLGLRRTFQTPQLFPTLSVVETVAVGCAQLRPHRHRPWLQVVGLPAARREFAADLEIALGALEQVRLAHLAGVAPHRLALGQQRIVEVARAIAAPGTTLLLDEPFAGLSREERDTLAALLRELAGNGWGLLIVDHNLDLVEALADVVTVMDTGRVIASGPPREVLRDAAVRQVYSGGI